VSDKRRAYIALWVSTLAFTVCFAVWMMDGVLVVHLVGDRVFDWSKTQMATLMAIPVLTGSLMRLPVSILTDKYGGKPVFGTLMLLAAIPTWLLSTATGYDDFWWLSLGFGLSGASFAVGIAFTSVWFGKERQGLVLGIFGAGNAGSALTSAFAPMLLKSYTAGGNVEGWRELPKLYAVVLAATGVLFLVLTTNRRAEGAATKSLAQRLAPLKHVKVWRFSLEYFLVFGGFVALSQWLVAYYVGAYQMPLVTAGLVASLFSWPSGVIRSFGGWLSDKFGGRAVLYWVLGFCVTCCAFLCVPRMDIESPGEATLALVPGTVESVSAEKIIVSGRAYPLRPQSSRSAGAKDRDEKALVLPTIESWQEPAVKVGDKVGKKGLLATGRTHIYFQANVWIFTALVFVLGLAMGIGKAAVYRNIPDDFPNDVAVVGGIVGVIGGLGGWACPLFFGWMLGGWGVWTTCWIFFLALSVACLVWLHLSVRRRLREKAPAALFAVEHGDVPAPAVGGAR
jgi:NNP family nitrate/nitrite transporter-like MFS transporter